MKTIDQCMKREVISIATTASVADAISLCVRHHIGTLPVVDGQGVLMGTLRLADLIDLGMPDFLQFLDHIEFIHTFGALELQHPGAQVLAQPITQVMKEAVAVEASAGLLRATAVLVKNHLMDIPVVDGHNHLVGLASRVDLGVALLQDWLDQPEA